MYYNRQRIAIHKRDPSKGTYNTHKEHLSSTHKSYVGRSPEYFRSKALEHGQYVSQCTTGILANAAHPEIGYKRVMGLFNFMKTMVQSDWTKPAEEHWGQMW